MNTDKYMLRAHTTVDNMVLNIDRHHVTQKVLGHLRSQLREAVLNEKVEEHQGTYSTTFSVSIMLIHPEEFHRIVQQGAMELYQKMNLSKMGWVE